jgi:hypothetical protein
MKKIKTYTLELMINEDGRGDCTGDASPCPEG